MRREPCTGKLGCMANPSPDKKRNTSGKSSVSAGPRTAVYWRDRAPASRVPSTRPVVIEDTQPFVLHFGKDGWSDTSDRFSIRLRTGAHGVRLETVELDGVRELNFTRFYLDEARWEGVDHRVEVDTRA